ncbi:MAG: hypothetical protein PHE27_08540 [Alphaproteobacteria bacterium]|nr:hypothetical protein [Alphaproteobacteria bacterium]
MDGSHKDVFPHLRETPEFTTLEIRMPRGTKTLSGKTRSAYLFAIDEVCARNGVPFVTQIVFSSYADSSDWFLARERDNIVSSEPARKFRIAIASTKHLSTEQRENTAKALTKKTAKAFGAEKKDVEVAFSTLHKDYYFSKGNPAFGPQP